MNIVGVLFHRKHFKVQYIEKGFSTQTIGPVGYVVSHSKGFYLWSMIPLIFMRRLYLVLFTSSHPGGEYNCEMLC